MKPGLYIIATPIGRLNDITLTAIDMLTKVDLVLCEDTRVTQKLLKNFDIVNKCEALHKFNEASLIDQLIAKVQSCQAIALVSDAGTPAIHDPGYRLVAAMQRHELDVFVVPGASAVIAALSIAGCAADSFTFKGFVPSKSVEKQKFLTEIGPGTVACFESPHRIYNTLITVAELVAPDRELVCCRELTKMHETIKVLKVSEITTWLAQQPILKGEWVLVFRPFEPKITEPSSAACKIIDHLVPIVGINKASKVAKDITNEPKNLLYDYALAKYG